MCFDMATLRFTWDELSGLGSLEHWAHPVSAATHIATHCFEPSVVRFLLL